MNIEALKRLWELPSQLEPCELDCTCHPLKPRQLTPHDETLASWPIRASIRERDGKGGDCRNYGQMGSFVNANSHLVRGEFVCRVCGQGVGVTVPFNGLNGDSRANAMKALIRRRVERICSSCEEV